MAPAANRDFNFLVFRDIQFLRANHFRPEFTARAKAAGVMSCENG
jgi:hypothetical protein